MGGGVLFDFGSENGSERIEIPVESVGISVGGTPKKDGDRTGEVVVGGIFNDSDDETLQQLRKVNCGIGHVEGSGGSFVMPTLAFHQNFRIIRNHF